jgi:hypothetical protein
MDGLDIEISDEKKMNGWILDGLAGMKRKQRMRAKRAEGTVCTPAV